MGIPKFALHIAREIPDFGIQCIEGVLQVGKNLLKDLRLTKTIDTDPVSRRISQLQVTGDQVKTVIQWQQSVEKCCIFG